MKNLFALLQRDFNLQIKTVQLINIALTVLGVGFLITNFSWYYLAIAIGSFLWFGIVGANAGFHRYFSHRSFKTSRFIEYVMAITGTLASLGSIISWIAIHRYHHLHADTAEDPHSPKYIGWWRAYTYDWNRTNISKKFIRDLIGDPMIVFLHKHYFKVIFVYVALLALIDPWLVVFAYAIPATGCLNGVAAVTVIGHIHGYTVHETRDTAKNSWIACIMSLGEGWHNNHHAHPYNWKQGEQWWEIDPPSWFIRLVSKK